MAAELTIGEARWGLRANAEALVASYSQILFVKSWPVGGLLLVATMLDPRLGLHGLVAVALSIATARALHFNDELIRAGIYGYNALLVGLGTAALLSSNGFAVTVLAAGSILSVFVTAAAQSTGATSRLPVLTLPFLAAYYLIVATTTSLGLSLNALPVGPEVDFLPSSLQLLLKSLGMIFFLPRVDVGFLVLAAIIVYSRLATLLALAGFGLALSVMQVSALSVLAGEVFPYLLTLNLVFSAIALGGVWFVPSRSALVLGIVGALVAAAITISIAPILARFGLPILILPFNLTIFLVLYAFRQRTRDESPKAVEFVPGTPERNFSYYDTHVARFGAHYSARLRAPFAGEWTCTQGVDGEHTHQGAWRNAFDFEVMDTEGRSHEGQGLQLKDYRCYGLPVSAPAPGLVVKVVNAVPDNAIGEPNLRENWGNLVLLRHEVGLHSMLCHLMPGSVLVHEGEWVTSGQQLGRCGNSGRSPVPHLHYQLQALARVGSPTIETELHDVVVQDPDGAPCMRGAAVITNGQQVRNLRVDDGLRNLFDSFLPGAHFELEQDGKKERVDVSIDLYGAKVMKSHLATLYFDVDEDRFVVFDVVGSNRSGLHVLRAALGRVPFEDNQDLRWRDHVAVSHVHGTLAKYAYEFFAPFMALNGVEVEYQAQRRGKRFHVTGRAVTEGEGTAPVTTEAVFEQGLGWVSAEIKTKRGATSITRATSRGKDDEIHN